MPRGRWRPLPTLSTRRGRRQRWSSSSTPRALSYPLVRHTQSNTTETTHPHANEATHAQTRSHSCYDHIALCLSTAALRCAVTYASSLVVDSSVFSLRGWCAGSPVRSHRADAAIGGSAQKSSPGAYSDQHISFVVVFFDSAVDVPLLRAPSSISTTLQLDKGNER